MDSTKEVNHVIVNICWNNSGWKGLCRHPERKTACEFWKEPRENKKLKCIDERQPFCGEAYTFSDGFRSCPFQNGTPKRPLTPGKSIIIFASRHFTGMYIVGFYVLKKLYEEDNWPHLVGKPHYSSGFIDQTILPLDKKRHLGGKKRIGQIGYNYIKPSVAKTILIDALKVHTSKKYRDRRQKIIIKKIERTLSLLEGISSLLPKEIKKVSLKKFKSKHIKEYEKKKGKYEKDLSKQEKSHKRHEYIVNLLAEKIHMIGYQPEEGGPLDLTAKIGRYRYLFEVKSCNKGTIKSQIRRGIAQLYEYKYFIFPNQQINLCLVLELEPYQEFVEYLENDRSILVMWLQYGSKFEGGIKTQNQLSSFVE